MATVISRERIEKHNVSKYSFKVIALGSKNGKAEDEKTFEQQEIFSEEHHPKRRKTDVDTSALNSSTKDDLIESLMKKTDEMSSNFIKLQMKLEQKEQEFEQQLQKAKEEAFAQGIQAGLAQAKEENDQQLKETLELYKASVIKLDQSAQELQEAIGKIQNELVGAAVDIAQEVIAKELSHASYEVALALSKGLIDELHAATKITLKVNPQDFTKLVESLGTLKNVEIVADSAVRLGGVVAISDAGNIDAEIQKRFEKVKKTALSE